MWFSRCSRYFALGAVHVMSWSVKFSVLYCIVRLSKFLLFPITWLVDFLCIVRYSCLQPRSMCFFFNRNLCYIPRAWWFIYIFLLILRRALDNFDNSDLYLIIAWIRPFVVIYSNCFDIWSFWTYNELKANSFQYFTFHHAHTTSASPY